jgi:hypothetical protein
MRVPQVKEAPAKGLRAMFAGIGQLLSMTDKLRGKSAASPDPETVVPAAAPPKPAATQTLTPETAAPETATPETVTPATAVAATAAPEAVVAETAAPETAAPETAAPETAVAETVIPEVKAAAKPRTAAKPRAAAKPAAAAPAAQETASTPGGHVRLIQPDEAPDAPAAPAPAPAAPAAAPTAELPLANYDELTIPSLRARLRNLSADQLGQLIAYEKCHAGRAEVITMFERRVAKLAEG